MLTYRYATLSTVQQRDIGPLPWAEAIMIPYVRRKKSPFDPII